MLAGVVAMILARVAWRIGSPPIMTILRFPYSDIPPNVRRALFRIAYYAQPVGFALFAVGFCLLVAKLARRGTPGESEATPTAE